MFFRKTLKKKEEMKPDDIYLSYTTADKLIIESVEC